jgi:hypothetical protein
MTEAVYIKSPVGRIVQGDVFAGSDKDMNGRPRTDKQGNLKTQWFIGVAFPKGPEWDAMWAQIYAVAQRDFPAGDYQQPGFAFKIADGDDPSNAIKDGFPGNYILRFTTGFCPDGYNAQNQPIDASSGLLVRGNFIEVNFSVRGNGERPAAQGGKPGVFINHSMLRFVGYGDPIVSGPTAEEAFGAAPVALPAGASATPIAQAGQMPAQQPAPLPPTPAPIQTAPVGTAPTVGVPVNPIASPSNPPAGVTPAPNFLLPPQ